MKFNKIGAMDHSVLSRALEQFTRLTIELGVRNDNPHVGSGLGGNNFQLMVLMGMKHVLSNRKGTSIRYVPHRNTMIWGAEWLGSTGLKALRPALDTVFETILEHQKVAALALEAMAYSDNLRATLDKYSKQFPKLISCLAGGAYEVDEALSPVNRLILASIMCQDLATLLDKGDLSKIGSIAAAMLDFEPEIVLLSIRRHIQIERLVKFNLDEHPVFRKVLMKVQKVYQ